MSLFQITDYTNRIYRRICWQSKSELFFFQSIFLFLFLPSYHHIGQNDGIILRTKAALLKFSIYNIENKQMIVDDLLEEEHDEESLLQRLMKFNFRSQPFRFIDDVNKKIVERRTSQDIDGLKVLRACPSTQSSDFCDKKQPASTKSSSSNNNENSYGHYESDLPEPSIKLLRNARKKITIQKKQSTDDPLQGKGVIKLKNGQTIFGTWKDGVLMGDARIVYPTGSMYIGEVKPNNIRHGKGTYAFKNGYKYQGQFKDGVIEGFGVLFNQFGEVINKGTWKNGCLVQGIC